MRICRFAVLVLFVSGFPSGSVKSECQIVHSIFVDMGGDTTSLNPFGAPPNFDCCLQSQPPLPEHGIICDNYGHITTIDWFCGAKINLITGTDDYGSGVKGQIPRSLANLTKLQFLSFWNCWDVNLNPNSLSILSKIKSLRKTA
jgi:hypothetical protein